MAIARSSMSKQLTGNRKAAKKVKKVMGEFKSGTLHAGKDPKGPKKAPIVKDRAQAIAIALSQAGKAKKKGASK